MTKPKGAGKDTKVPMRPTRKRRASRAVKDSDTFEMSAQEREMMEMAFKNSLIEQAAQENGLQDLPELMTLYPTEEEFKEPLVYIEKMYRSLGDKEQGGVKIVPPASFKPPCVFNPDQNIESRFQTLQDLGQNIPFKENKQGMSFEDWKKQATEFQDAYKFKTEGTDDED